MSYVLGAHKKLAGKPQTFNLLKFKALEHYLTSTLFFTRKIYLMATATLQWLHIQNMQTDRKA